MPVKHIKNVPVDLRRGNVENARRVSRLHPIKKARSASSSLGAGHPRMFCARNAQRRNTQDRTSNNMRDPGTPAAAAARRPLTKRRRQKTGYGAAADAADRFVDRGTTVTHMVDAGRRPPP